MAAKKRSEKQGEELPKARINRASLSHSMMLFRYIGPFKWQFFLGLLFLFLTGATAIIFPKLMGSLIDSGDISPEQINKMGLWLLLLFALQAIFSYMRVILFVNVTENLLLTLRTQTYNKLIRMPMHFFANRRVGEINSRISADLSQIGDTFTINIAEFLRQLIIIGGGIAALFLTSVKLALVMLAVIPVVAVIAVIFGRYIRRLSKQVQDQVAESNTIVEETMQGIANVKAFANEYFESLRYGNTAVEIKKLAVTGGKARGAFFSFIIFCLFGSIILLIWYAVKLENAGELTHGVMIQFMLYTIFVGASIGGIAEQYAQIQKAVGATERVLEILDEKAEDISDKVSSDLARFKGSLSFESVSFAYPSRPEVEVLKSLTFHAEPGQSIALVGPSGAGKSTITTLLLRFYEPNSGRIMVDQQPSASYPLTNYRNQMALVPQDVFLFGGTIFENIAYARPGCSAEEVRAAAEQANAREFIESFPQQYQTVVGERGVKLSGGQRQRIAIARAVLKNPSILILDEATSSLDSESERLVQEALEKLMKGRTTIIIAHRLSTIRNVDKILVIDEGCVVESGNHNELMLHEDGLYRSLVMLQQDKSLFSPKTI